ncbi:hypothetical protein XW81_02270 [Buchnera aphidicola (Schlechtendalia chinensis)]|uniref:Methionyl-tRNA formyltransferase n=1 Tax=Buchnera aphidicola subsp. Schlechtendalia chinensis TaxID=118110 RepID=A0A172WDY6_BUCSC|nr:methionyl-tRNA formyltransferase [Buchnera aphidicola]ANF17200.1 hypothetical protein XW81_02270 [Buchnera aphidicola (Schlechtendalia chinensis)]
MKHSKLLKIIFAGTPDFSAKHLIQIIRAKYKIVGVLTKTDKPSGRGKLILESPVKKIAKKHKIPIFQPEIENITQLHTQLYELHADLMIVVSYGLILPENILNMFPLGCINVHASLLPRWRGATPIQSAILYGDSITGISIIKMEKGVDTGKILCSSSCKIKNTDTSASLQDKLSIISYKTTLLALKMLSLSYDHYVSQSKLITYSSKIKKQDAQLNWSKDAIILERCIRAFNPWPISFFKIDNKLIRVWKANVIMQYHNNIYKEGEIILINKNGLQIQTKRNVLNIIKLQLPGKTIMHAHNLKNFKKKFLIPRVQLV